MEEIIEVAGDVVVIAAHHGIGRRSGVEINGESAYLYGVEGEKIARVAFTGTGARPSRPPACGSNRMSKTTPS
jgi:hypothetical protein